MSTIILRSMQINIDDAAAIVFIGCMTNEQIIDALPRQAIIDKFDASRQVLHIWRKRGVPKSKRIAYGRLAADCGVALPQSFFDEADS